MMIYQKAYQFRVQRVLSLKILQNGKKKSADAWRPENGREVFIGKRLDVEDAVTPVLRNDGLWQQAECLRRRNDGSRCESQVVHFEGKLGMVFRVGIFPVAFQVVHPEERVERCARIFVLVRDVVPYKVGQLQQLPCFREGKQVNRQEKYGDKLPHCRAKLWKLKHLNVRMILNFCD